MSLDPENPHLSTTSRFAIEREVGRGGVGIVYRAVDRLSGCPVALKVIAVTGVSDEEEARFVREGRVLASLSHDGIVSVIASGKLDDGRPFVAMEWLDGEDLSQRQARGALTIDECLELGAAVADALAAAHAAGIIHRDVKPSNIFLARTAAGIIPKLVDFGVATAGDAKLTGAGSMVGTPAYMAPEQARGESAVDARADIYALGATLFEAMTGRPPHVGPTPIAILARLVTTPAPRLSDVLAGVPQHLDDFMCSLLATDRAERPSSAEEVATEFRRILETLTEDIAASQRVEPSGRAALSMWPPSTNRSGGSRLITTIVATKVAKGPSRTRLLTQMRARGADATEVSRDAIVAHLGATRALGDEAFRALELGLRIARLGGAVGIASGRMRVERTRPQGEVVDRAAALARDAKASELIADATTTELARGRYEFQMRGDGSAIVSAPRSGRHDGTGGSPFVGREVELARIIEAFGRSVERSTPVVVTVTGAPGIGKTRLRREALARIAGHASHARVIHARCEAFARSHALGVVAEVARGMTSVAKGAGLEEALDRTDDLIALVGSQCSEQARDLIARLIANLPLPSLDTERGARDALWLALTEMAVGLARKQPLVIEAEDAHWADAESLAWLDHLLARAGGTRVLVLATARPNLWRHDPRRFSGRDHTRIELGALGKSTLVTIAESVLGARADGEAGQALVESIARQAAGSPLFAEELSRLAATGRDAASAPTIEAAMQAHLDALDDGPREAAISLAVFGLLGWDDGLSALGVANAKQVLRDLCTAEIVVEQAVSRFAGAREYAFKHALLREVAYASLGEESLELLHARAGRWLASKGEDDAVVARHLELGKASEEAGVYLEKAARRALSANALAESVSLAERALAFASENHIQFPRAQLLDESWSRLDARAAERETAVSAMQDAVFDTASEIRARGARLRFEDAGGGNPDTNEDLDRVVQDASAAGIVDEEARCAATLATRLAYAGHLERASDLSDRLLELSNTHGIAAARVDAWQTRAVIRQARGEVLPALEARREAAASARKVGLKTREATLMINMGFALTTIGAAEEAREAIDEGIAIAEAVGSPGTERHGKMILLCWTSCFGTDAAANRLLEETRGIADATSTSSWVAHDRATLGILYYRGVELLRDDDDGSVSRARALLRAATLGYRATSMFDVLPAALGYWAEAERRSGHSDKAYELAAEASTLLDKGSPSLLNEAPIFLALFRAAEAEGRAPESKAAIAAGLPRLVMRLRGLRGTPYACTFLSKIRDNASLLDTAEKLGIRDSELEELRQPCSLP